MAALVRGVNAEIRWSYYVAARVEGYEVAYLDARARWSLSATVVEADAYKLAQRPLMFVAPTQHGAYRWPIESLTPPANGRFGAVSGVLLPLVP
jgi:hypothetical protein